VAKNKSCWLQLDDWAVRSFFDYFYGFAGEKIANVLSKSGKNYVLFATTGRLGGLQIFYYFTDLQGNIT